MADQIPVLIITGPVGVGKTSSAIAASSILDQTGVAHAMVDVDHLRWCHPSPADDPFHIRLGMHNLALVCANYRAAGAKYLILVDVVEEREQLADYAAAIPGAAIQIVRLHAPVAQIWRRLEGRETGSDLDWHQQRAVVLAEQMERDAVEDILIDTTDKTPAEVAQEILNRAGWS